MRLLHTSDWHLGKVLKGQSRVDEQIAVLAEIVEVAKARQPDLVIVAGDIFDTAAPAAETKKIAVRALSALRRHAGAVVVIAGNHDHGGELDALRPWAEGVGITLRGTLGRPEDHVVTGRTAGGEAWRIVALPFVSQRYAVRAGEMFELTAAQANATYADHLARLVAALTEASGAEAPCAEAGEAATGAAGAVQLATAHLTVVGGKLGGGERDAHTIEAYAVPSTIFPSGLHYVALGHLHRRQQVVGACPVHYCGSPFAIDFGEEHNTPSVSIVEVSAAKAARVEVVPIGAAVPLLTVRGSLDELAKLNVDATAWLRVYVKEAPRAGLKEQVQQLLPRALEIRIDPELLPQTAVPRQRVNPAGRTPSELFGEYLDSTGVADPAVGELFGRLYEEVSTP